jgi:NADPH:quinone reductase-like Zn-dependent oxidoreductase
VTYRRYGGPEVLRVEDVERPVPADDEVLVRVQATTVNRTDTGFRRGVPRIARLFSGLRRPRRHVLGTEFAGVVEEVGAEVTEFAPGDAVFGVNVDRFGAHAEYVCVRQGAPIAHVPAGLGPTEAAPLGDGGILALTCLRWAKVEAGQRVLVYGASGAIGTAGVQLAKHLGAEVTAVCDSAHVAMVETLGADRVVDRGAEDFTSDPTTYDVVFDAVGKTSLGRCRRLLVRGGTFVDTDFGPKGQVPFLAVLTWFTSRLGGRKVLLAVPRYRKEQVLFLKGLVEAGEYRAVVDRCVPLEEAAEAHRYVETERKGGNVVLTVP